MQQLHDARIDAIDLAHHADIDKRAGVRRIGHVHLACADQATVRAGQPHRATAVFVDQVYDVFVDLPAEHHFDHIHGLGIGDAHALNEYPLLADFFQPFVDLRTAAVHHHRVHTHQLQQHHVARETFAQRLIGHRIAAVFHDDGFAMKALNIRQRFREDLGFNGGVG